MLFRGHFCEIQEILRLWISQKRRPNNIFFSISARYYFSYQKIFILLIQNCLHVDDHESQSKKKKKRSYGYSSNSEEFV